MVAVFLSHSFGFFRVEFRESLPLHYEGIEARLAKILGHVRYEIMLTVIAFDLRSLPSLLPVHRSAVHFPSQTLLIPVRLSVASLLRGRNPVG